jgi:hypothetical protein
MIMDEQIRRSSRYLPSSILRKSRKEDGITSTDKFYLSILREFPYTPSNKILAYLVGGGETAETAGWHLSRLEKLGVITSNHRKGKFRKINVNIPSDIDDDKGLLICEEYMNSIHSCSRRLVMAMETAFPEATNHWKANKIGMPKSTYVQNKSSGVAISNKTKEVIPQTQRSHTPKINKPKEVIPIKPKKSYPIGKDIGKDNNIGKDMVKKSLLRKLSTPSGQTELRINFPCSMEKENLPGIIEKISIKRIPIKGNPCSKKEGAPGVVKTINTDSPPAAPSAAPSALTPPLQMFVKKSVRPIIPPADLDLLNKIWGLENIIHPNKNNDGKGMKPQQSDYSAVKALRASLYVAWKNKPTVYDMVVQNLLKFKYGSRSQIEEKLRHKFTDEEIFLLEERVSNRRSPGYRGNLPKGKKIYFHRALLDYSQTHSEIIEVSLRPPIPIEEDVEILLPAWMKEGFDQLKWAQSLCRDYGKSTRNALIKLITELHDYHWNELVMKLWNEEKYKNMYYFWSNWLWYYEKVLRVMENMEHKNFRCNPGWFNPRGRIMEMVHKQMMTDAGIQTGDPKYDNQNDEADLTFDDLAFED